MSSTLGDNMIIKVRTKIEFEIEYPLDTELYNTENEAELFAKEEELVAEDPLSFVELSHRRDAGRIIVTVDKVEE